MLEIWQDLALEFCRKQNKAISILTEIHVKHDQVHQSDTEVDIDSKRKVSVL